MCIIKCTKTVLSAWSQKQIMVILVKQTGQSVQSVQLVANVLKYVIM